VRGVKHWRLVVENSSHCRRLGGLPETGRRGSRRRQQICLPKCTINIVLGHLLKEKGYRELIELVNCHLCEC